MPLRIPDGSDWSLNVKILTIDIETTPNLGYIWSLWKQTLSLSQLVETGEVICFAAKWYGSRKILYYSVHHDGKEAMLQAAHDLLSEADVVVHYNGKGFDIPHLQREFLLAGMEPPAPFAQVDLLHVVKKQFRFVSNKLDHVVQELGIGAKTSHTGFQLWLDCMAGSDKAWNLMRKYNRQDVVITERLYDRLRPWIPSHPAHSLYNGSDEDSCPNCGSTELKPQGYSYTSVSVFQRYKCADCGRWSRGQNRIGSTKIRGV